MARYATVRDSDGAVVKITIWDGDTSKWSPPPGHTAILDNGTAQVGGTWNGSAFLPAPAPRVEEGPWFSVLGSDQVTNSITLIDLPLSMRLWAGKKYLIECHFWFRTAATTTGILFSFTGPASPTLFDLTAEIATSNTAFNMQRITAYDGGTPTTGIDVANTDRLARLRCLIQPSIDGTLQLRWRSEVNSNVTLRAGSQAQAQTV